MLFSCLASRVLPISARELLTFSLHLADVRGGADEDEEESEDESSKKKKKKKKRALEEDSDDEMRHEKLLRAVQGSSAKSAPQPARDCVAAGPDSEHKYHHQVLGHLTSPVSRVGTSR